MAASIVWARDPAPGLLAAGRTEGPRPKTSAPTAKVATAALTAPVPAITGTATVTAKSSAANYALAAKTWKYDLRTAVTTAAPAVRAAGNTVKGPARTGVAYDVNGVRKNTGTHSYAGTVTTQASTGSYKRDGTVSWKFDNRNAVTPTKQVFSRRFPMTVTLGDV